MTYSHGAIVRGDTSRRTIAVVFTGDTFGDGATAIAETLQEKKIKASFFLTGNFYRNPDFKNSIKRLKHDGHYLGAHSDKHLLYCAWADRDSLLIDRNEFTADLRANYAEMKRLGIAKHDAIFFLPPYEWFNDSIASWTKAEGLQLINFTPGTLSHADYTTPDMRGYQSSDEIFNSIVKHEERSGMNGFILLLHVGTDAKRRDRFYTRLGSLIDHLLQRKYTFVRIDKMLRER